MPGTRSILIVDDNVTLAVGCAKLLIRAGYSVDTAFSAEDGMRLAQLQRPDAIILDFRMPFINGAGFLYRLRELPEHRDTPVMVLTGMTISDQQRAELAGLGAVVRFKPIEPPDFLAAAATLLMPSRRAS
jgi:two-component system chemotaxis sensor kinase CheA